MNFATRELFCRLCCFKKSQCRNLANMNSAQKGFSFLVSQLQPKKIIFRQLRRSEKNETDKIGSNRFGRRNVGERRMDQPSAEFAPEKAQAEFFRSRPLSDLWKPAAFALGFSGCCFVGASIWQYERRKHRSDFLFNSRNWGYTVRKHGQWREELNKKWSSLSDGEKSLLVLFALNGVVLAAWRFVPRLQSVMIRYFTNSFYTEKLCSPMLLSTFSHYSFVHFGLNMFVLWSFGSQVIDRFLGMEQFTALYLSAGVLASLAGIAHKAVARRYVSALGASGAILAILTYSCMKMPQARLSIVFLPFFTFSAGAAVYGIIAFDALGLLLRWKMFDHAAHLGGSLFGIWYGSQGELLYRKHKDKVAKRWKQWTDRKPPGSGGHTPW